ncbi:hypothetical protein [Sorangium atrum]|uniref:Uncharacterized protein n=1 Tax=Sorangium atrum TaxID=2995308 RepID=A0ABT5BZ84_9BACT|nr:hypothetical protein [Sorangium aterium]MDC0678262.1 hypothetical protein [Sorangium aterium]
MIEQSEPRVIYRDTDHSGRLIEVAPGIPSLLNDIRRLLRFLDVGY